MDGKVFNSEGQYVANIRANEIYDLSGRKLYYLRGQKIYKPTVIAGGERAEFTQTSIRICSADGIPGVASSLQSPPVTPTALVGWRAPARA